jgi:hypothetical protein
MRISKKKVIVGLVVLIISTTVFFLIEKLSLENIIFSTLFQEAEVIPNPLSFNLYYLGLAFILIFLARLSFFMILNIKRAISKIDYFILILGILTICVFIFSPVIVFYKDRASEKVFFSEKKMIYYNDIKKVEIFISIIPVMGGGGRQSTTYNCNTQYTLNVAGFNKDIILAPRDHKKIKRIITNFTNAGVKVESNISIFPSPVEYVDCQEVYDRELKSQIEQDLSIDL